MEAGRKCGERQRPTVDDLEDNMKEEAKRFGLKDDAPDHTKWRRLSWKNATHCKMENAV